MALDDLFREKVLAVRFVAYDKPVEHLFFDTTIDQALNYIFKNICHTAIIKSATEYEVRNPKAIELKKKKLTDEELQKMYK